MTRLDTPINDAYFRPGMADSLVWNVDLRDSGRWPFLADHRYKAATSLGLKYFCDSVGRNWRQRPKRISDFRHWHTYRRIAMARICFIATAMNMELRKSVWCFSDYRHHVFTNCRGKIYSMPINLSTMCSFFGRAMSPNEARALIAAHAQEVAGTPENLEEKAISLVGRPLYEAFIQGYTSKQWQTDPKELPLISPTTPSTVHV